MSINRYIMNFKTIESFDQLKKELSQPEKSFLLLYKADFENSMCALNKLKKLDLSKNQLSIFTVDVAKVRDIHEKYNITSVPSLMEFKKGELKQVVKGCHEPGFYKSLFDSSLYSAVNDKEQKKANRIVVYTTPTCPHCTTVKNYLKGLKIPFRDINVAQDQKMAEQMVKKSGQQGVPQIEINGKIIVGFDKAKIDDLLEIK